MSALAVFGLLVLVVTSECEKRESATWRMGFETGVEAAIEGGSYVRWGECIEGGRHFRCARTSEGTLIEVRMP